MASTCLVGAFSVFFISACLGQHLSDFPVVEGTRTSCSCYTLENKFCCAQAICVCENICHNGTHLVGTEPVCHEGEDAAPHSPLTPIPCSDEDVYKYWFQRLMNGESNLGPVGLREASWFSTRASIEWRTGMSYVQKLGNPEGNIAHLTGKVNHLLLMNNATIPAFLPRVDRFLFPRSPYFLERIRLYGSESYHATLLHQLLSSVLAPLVGRDVVRSKAFLPHHLLGDDALAEGRVEFDAPFKAASEEHPLCFQRAVFPGVLKAITYPGGAPVARAFQQQLLRSLDLQVAPPVGQRVRLLYLARSGATTQGRRVLTPASKAALRHIIDKFGFEVREMEFSGLTFREQLRLVREADIIVSVHGAALVNPGSYARPDTVVVELQPYHVFHIMYGIMTVNSGATFLTHQLRQGSPQPGDAEFDGVGVYECTIKSPRCKEYFTHRRRMEITPADGAAIEGMLALARDVTLRARAGLAEAGAWLRDTHYPRACVAQKRSYKCRSTVLRSHLADPDVECVLQQDCAGSF